MAQPTALLNALGAPGALIDLRFSTYWIFVWLSAAATAALYHALARPAATGGRAAPLRSLGLGLMVVPAWMAVWGFVDSISVLADPNSVLRPISPEGLTRIYAHGLLRDLGYLGVGFLLWTAHHGLPTSLHAFAARLRDEGFPLGRRGREGASILHGAAWFPVLLVGTVLVNAALTNAAPALTNGDESRVWDNLTVYTVVMVSLTAAFTEELTYRVLLLVAFQRLLLRAGQPERTALWGAVAVQSIVFGLAHAGYGTWIHVLLPTFFGVIAGVAAVRFGLWTAVVLHFLVNVYALGSEVFSEVPWFETLLLWGLVLNLALTLAVGIQWALRRTDRRRARPA